MKEKLSPKQAAEKIIAQVAKLTSADIDEGLLKFYVEKTVAEVMAYCHIKHFPEPLVYSAVEAILMTLNEVAENEGAISSSAPLQKIKQDDTEFTFNVNSASAGSSFSDLVFDSLKPKLNLFRRMIAF